MDNRPVAVTRTASRHPAYKRASQIEPRQEILSALTRSMEIETGASLMEKIVQAAAET